MSVLSRITRWIKNVFGSEMSPEDKIDNAENQIQSSLDDIKRAIADLTAQKKRLEIQRSRIKEVIKTQEEEARKFVDEGKDEKAREILKRKRRNKERINDLEEQIERMNEIQSELTSKKENVLMDLRELRTTRSNINARKKAAKAEVIMSDGVEGINGTDVQDTLRNLESEVAELEAKAEVLGSESTFNTNYSEKDEDSKNNDLDEDSINDDIQKELDEIKE